MRKTTLFNDNWTFTKNGETCAVTLPHTWNAKDGQDGGNDYYRGTCTYTKRFARPETDGEVWLEFRGAAMTAEVFLNDRELARHEGGYSTFRVELTDALEEENLLTVTVDNGKNERVYPQKADFTFYGGLYRDVYLICVPKEHFALDDCGSSGIQVTPVLSEDLSRAAVTVETRHNAEHVTITVNGETKTVKDTAVFTIENPRLWDGLDDPYLYTASAELPGGDRVSADFGIRKIAFDPEKGFFLNNHSYRLCGAARHQDREGLGSALTKKEHEEDITLLLEMGANSVRLAHYQHDQYFYELCDRSGLAVWAEIPYISLHLKDGDENSRSQLRELIVQNYNHPSIVCWSLSNEITITAGSTPEILENHRALNALAHELDPTRPTVTANGNMLEYDDPILRIPDIVSFNHYYGWYLGEISQTARWCDDFHAANPDGVMGISEYGADANPAYQTGKAVQGDWTEQYQAWYHETMLKMWAERPYIWAMHAWNMFDFGADGRDGGGKPGQNQKGLVTFDRKIKKDAFYIYKAYLSKEPFVHICSRRYVDRPEAETEVKVYSNLPTVTLLLDGRELETKAGDKVFTFRVPLSGEHRITAVSGECRDEITVCKVEAPNPAYRMDGAVGEVEDWFDRADEVLKDGSFSIKDKMADVKAHPVAGPVLMQKLAPLYAKVMASFGGDAAKTVNIPEKARAMMDQLSVEATLKQLGQLVPKQLYRELNTALNEIKK